MNTSTIMRIYQARLLKTFKTEEEHPKVYMRDTWQYVYQDNDGFLVLLGKRSTSKSGGVAGWIFGMNAKPGVDFVWPYDVDPRTPEEKTQARDLVTIEDREPKRGT